jgi:hypothetical protein
MRHVYLYPTQPLIPQCLALGLNFIKRGSTNLGFRVGTSLLLREERNANADDHLCWALRKLEERARFNHVTRRTTREYELCFAKSSYDVAVPMFPKFNSPTGSSKKADTDGSTVQTPN